MSLAKFDHVCQINSVMERELKTIVCVVSYLLTSYSRTYSKKYYISVRYGVVNLDQFEYTCQPIPEAMRKTGNELFHQISIQPINGTVKENVECLPLPNIFSLAKVDSRTPRFVCKESPKSDSLQRKAIVKRPFHTKHNPTTKYRISYRSRFRESSRETYNTECRLRTISLLIYMLINISPPNEWTLEVWVLKKRPKPKSPNFTSPFDVINTFAGLISERWTYRSGNNLSTGAYISYLGA